MYVFVKWLEYLSGGYFLGLLYFLGHEVGIVSGSRGWGEFWATRVGYFLGHEVGVLCGS